MTLVAEIRAKAGEYDLDAIRHEQAGDELSAAWFSALALELREIADSFEHDAEAA